MREIKFRAWDTENNCWYEPVFEAYKGNLWEIVISFKGRLAGRKLGGIIEDESLWPDRYKLMQYTGLKDKNGVEIFEGDILRAGENQQAFDVFWAVNAGGFMSRHSYVQVFDYPHYEVIGNIYENPELLNPPRGPRGTGVEGDI